MVCRTRRDFRPFVSERVKIFPKVLNEWRSEFVNADISGGGLIYDPIVDVRQVENVLNLKSLQIPPKNIGKNERAKVANMCEIPNCRPANVHPYRVIFQRPKFFRLTSQCVEKFEHKR